MIIEKIRYYALALLLLSVHHSFGGPIDNAKTLYNNGQYEQAAEELSKIVKKLHATVLPTIILEHLFTNLVGLMKQYLY